MVDDCQDLRALVLGSLRTLVLLPGVALAGALCAAEPSDTNYDESHVLPYELPDPLVSPSPTGGPAMPLTSPDQWPARRREIVKLFEQSVYGQTPQERLPNLRMQVVHIDPHALAGRATRKLVTIHLTAAEEPRIDVLLYIPNQRNQPAPCFVGLNFYGNQTVHDDPGIPINPRWMRNNDQVGIVDHRATLESRGHFKERWQVETLINRGYALATAYYGDIDPDNYAHDFSDGVHPLFYKPGQTEPGPHDWGAIGAWAWGLSRMMDYLATDSDIDAKRVAVVGLSRLGKTALWAGAQDERFAMVISTNSGCGGAALYRRNFGEQIHHMVKPIGYWFCRAHAEYAHREHELPVDQHMLLALVAPRPVYVASATNDRWADPRGEFLAAVAADRVYRFLGTEGLPQHEMPAPDQPVHGRIGYHLRTGDHDVTGYDWQQYLDFADKNL